MKSINGGGGGGGGGEKINYPIIICEVRQIESYIYIYIKCYIYSILEVIKYYKFKKLSKKTDWARLFNHMIWWKLFVCIYAYNAVPM